jgi:tetratricopeptide (TPR) repeat protein
VTMDDPAPPVAVSADDGHHGIVASRRLQRFMTNLNRLHDDLRETQRISDIADLVDTAGDAYQLGDTAERCGDLKGAERHFRRAADEDSDDATYRLALILDAQAYQLEIASDSAHVIPSKRAEALVWYQHALEIGVGGHLPQASYKDASRTPSWLLPGPAVSCG